MAKAERAKYAHQPKGYTRRISDHIAAALIVYTLMLIFLVTPELKSAASIWPYFLLVVLVAAIVPFFRAMDHRWQVLEHSELSASGLQTRYLLDRIKLWIIAIGIPLLLAISCRTLSAVF
jgi:hypothetical protein